MQKLIDEKTGSFICPYCGGPMYWQSDYSLEDAGYDGDGMVSYYHCPKCGTDIEIYLPIKWEGNE